MKNKFLKGMCYSAFPRGYDPSTANNTCIFFGSDITSYNLSPLWGDNFIPSDGPDKDKHFLGRKDIRIMKEMGVNLIRLYDWDARNDHLPFLDYCHTHNIKVLAPVSNYNLGAFGTPPSMDESIHGLIKSFSNEEGDDYHPAIYGIIIGSELDLTSKMPKDYLLKYTKRWVEIENEHYNNFTNLPIGHPVSFSKHSKKYPCFGFWDNLITPLKEVTTKDLNSRLILCPHTYNDAEYLFKNAENSYRGWVDITYEKYNLPILFCEIGCSRVVREDYNDVIAQQLERSWDYHKLNPDKLLGTCFFQYCDKVWIPNTSEGSFGVFTNSKHFKNIIRYGAKDFTHFDGNNCDKQVLQVNHLDRTSIYNTIKLIYNL